MKVFILVVLAMVVLVACGSEPDTGAAGSGIEGTVAIGPTCPVQTAESPCEDAPYKAELTVTTGGKIVATGESAQDGTFRIAVPPGTYTVTAGPLGGDPIIGSDPISRVVVHVGDFTHLAISFDSGIR